MTTTTQTPPNPTKSRFSIKNFLADVVAGITGAVAGAPQAMGFAIIAGISPIYGLYSAVVATVFGSLAASSSFMTIAPTNALALVVGSTLMIYPEDAQIERLFILTFLVGIGMILFAVLRLGNLVRFVSNAVMTGFITGAGLLIMLGQIRHMNGYRYNGTAPIMKFWDWLIHVHLTDFPTLIVGSIAIIIILILRETRLKNIAILTALVAATVMVQVFDLQTVALVRDISPIPSGLPAFVMPNWSHAPSLISPAIALTVLGLVQSVGITQSVPEKDGTVSDSTRDFIAQGAANVVSSFFQGMPSAGSLSRTATNVAAGAESRWANIFAGVFIGIVLVLLGSTIELVPLAGLAAQLLVAAASLIRPKAIMNVWRVNIPGRIAMTATFISTMTLPLEYSIYIGVVLSLLLYVYTSAGSVRAVRLEYLGEHRFREVPIPEKLPTDEPLVVYVAGHMYFAAVRYLETLLPKPDIETQHPVVILRIRDNVYLGSTGLRVLSDYARRLHAQGGRLILAGVSPTVKEQLERTNGCELLGKENIYFADDVVFSATERALEDARAWLKERLEQEKEPHGQP